MGNHALPCSLNPASLPCSVLPSFYESKVIHLPISVMMILSPDYYESREGSQDNREDADSCLGDMAELKGRSWTRLLNKIILLVSVSASSL